ncbi:MAG: hypothetical protein AAFV53_16970 [Myxococcota bacterium]
MKSRIPLSLLALCLFACADSEEAENTVAGIWLVQIPGVIADTTCDTTISHNFINAVTPQEDEVEDSPWAITFTEEVSDQLAFFQIELLGEDEAILIAGDEVWPGVPSGDSWTFTWVDFENSDETRSYEELYDYTDASDESLSSTITFTQTDNSASGQVSTSSSNSETWTETDSWDPKLVPVFNSEIPSSLYLQDADGFSIVNDAFEDDCTEENCQLAVSSTCNSATSFTARRTDFDDADAYDYLEGVGQGVD